MILPLELRDDWGTYQTTLVQLGPGHQIRYIQSSVDPSGWADADEWNDTVGRYVVLEQVRAYKLFGIPFGPRRWVPRQTEDCGLVEITRYVSREDAGWIDPTP